MTTTSYYSRTHWQCWVIPQIFVTRGTGDRGRWTFALGFRWLFWGASVMIGDA